MATFSFEATRADVKAHPDRYVDAICASLESEFLVLPKGDGFLDYRTFDQGYEALKKATEAFADLNPATLVDLVAQAPVCIIVVRAMLGFTPPEWAYVSAQRSSLEITQGFARVLDREARVRALSPMRLSGGKRERVMAMITTACDLLKAGAPPVNGDKVHRLDKADTKPGLTGIQGLAEVGAPYSLLLYERFLGRPFAGHRDSVSELVGGGLETKIEEVLSAAGISYVKTKRAQRVDGFDQAPDFIIPNQLNPEVVIEAKITEDDGTARDKITRVQHLAFLSGRGLRGKGRRKFQVIACIGGRGFGVRREDMRKLLLATEGKVFTLKQLDRLVDHTELSRFRTRSSPPPRTDTLVPPTSPEN